MLETVKYKDSFVTMIRHTNSKIFLNPRRCYCCNKDIQMHEQVVLMISDYKYIPKMYLHESCYDSFLNKENFIGNIEKDYREYKVNNEIFGNI